MFSLIPNKKVVTPSIVLSLASKRYLFGFLSTISDHDVNFRTRGWYVGVDPRFVFSAKSQGFEFLKKSGINRPLLVWISDICRINRINGPQFCVALHISVECYNDSWNKIAWFCLSFALFL